MIKKIIEFLEEQMNYEKEQEQQRNDVGTNKGKDRWFRHGKIVAYEDMLEYIEELAEEYDEDIDYDDMEE